LKHYSARETLRVSVELRNSTAYIATAPTAAQLAAIGAIVSGHGMRGHIACRRGSAGRAVDRLSFCAAMTIR
jgi:hypothetical protein